MEMKMKRTVFCLCAAAGLAFWSAAAQAAQSDLDKALAQLPALQYGSGDETRNALNHYAAAAAQDPRLRRRLEEAFLKTLQSPTPPVTLAAKDFACRALQLVGSEKAVPVLAGLLDDPLLSHLARKALEPMPYDAVDRAFREALDRTSGSLKIGVIGSIGQRRDAGATDRLSLLLRGPDPAIAGAAARALGKIATSDAAAALAERFASTRGQNRAVVAQACLNAARRLLAKGQAGEAARLYRALAASPPSRMVREAAFLGLIRAEPDNAPARLLQALRGSEARMRRLAGRALADWAGPALPAEVAAALPRLPQESQAIVLEAAAKRKDATVLPAARTLALRGPEAVRLAAVAALGAAGSASDAVLLARLASGETGPVGPAAQEALLNLSGEGMDQAMLDAARSLPGPARAQLIRSLVRRRASGLAPQLAGFLGDSDLETAKAAAEACAALGGPNELAALLAQWSRAADAPRREAFFQAAQRLCARLGKAASAPLLKAYAAADAAQKPELLRLFSTVGSQEALDAARSAMRSGDPALTDAAARALAEWPDIAALADLYAIIRRPPAPVHRTLAFRGYVRLATRGVPELWNKWACLRTLLREASSLEEKRLMISALGETPTPEALQAAAKFLDDSPLADEAGAAVVRIGKALGKKQAKLLRPILEKVVQKAKSKPVRDDAQALLRSLGG